MTVAELEILVDASIEPALKKIKSLMPQIKQHVTQAVTVAQKSMEKIDTKKVSKEIHEAFDPNDISELKIDGIKVTIKEIKGVSKEIQKLSGHIKQIEKQQIRITPKTQPLVQKQASVSGNTVQTTQQTKELSLWTKIVRQYYAYLDVAKKKISELKQETEKAKDKASIFKNHFNHIPKITQKITSNIKNMGTGLKSGLKHVLKYAMALFSLRSIYSVLSNSASAWLSSQNKGAQQLSANIEYMKYAMRKCICSCNRNSN